jgi:hypothetical protein
MYLLPSINVTTLGWGRNCEIPRTSGVPQAVRTTPYTNVAAGGVLRNPRMQRMLWHC